MDVCTAHASRDSRWKSTSPNQIYRACHLFRIASGVQETPKYQILQDIFFTGLRTPHRPLPNLLKKYKSKIKSARHLFRVASKGYETPLWYQIWGDILFLGGRRPPLSLLASNTNTWKLRLKFGVWFAFPNSKMNFVLLRVDISYWERNFRNIENGNQKMYTI